MLFPEDIFLFPKQNVWCFYKHDPIQGILLFSEVNKIKARVVFDIHKKLYQYDMALSFRRTYGSMQINLKQ